MTSCDHPVDCDLQIDSLCNAVPLCLQCCGKKSVFAPLIQGPKGPPGKKGPEGPRGESFLPVNKSSFVDAQYGDNTLALPERLGRPYATLQAALDEIPSGESSWQIYLWPGTYTVGTLEPRDYLNLDLRGSGPATTTLIGRVKHSASTNLTIANLSLETPDGEPSFLLAGSGKLEVRDSVVERTANGVDEQSLATALEDSTGEILIQDSLLSYTSNKSSITVSNRGSSSSIHLLENELSIKLTNSTETRVVEQTSSGQTELADNVINLTFPNLDFDLYTLTPSEELTGQLILNDNYHSIFSPGYSSSFRLYVIEATAGDGSTRPAILGRNNEYHFLNLFEEGSVTSVTNTTETHVKVVDDTILEPSGSFPRFMPTVTPASTLDPNSETEIQVNTGNSLATNQGIQLATRETTVDTTMTDDDFFLNATGGLVMTVTLPDPSSSYRGKLVVIRNDQVVAVNVATVTGGNFSSIPANTTHQYLATVTSWHLTSVFP